MGLDSVELLMAVEDAFEISISDQEATKIITVGDFYSCVLEKLGDRQSRECLSSWVFYQVRRAIMTMFKVPRNKITPRQKVEELIPKEDRRAHWEKLGKALDVQLPGLRRNEWMETTILYVLLAIFLGGLILMLLPGKRLLGSILIGSGIPFWLIIYKVTEPLAVWAPREASTVGDLVQVVLNNNFGKIAKSKACWNEEEVWKTLCSIIVYQTGVKPEEVKKEARIVQDLRID